MKQMPLFKDPSIIKEILAGIGKSMITGIGLNLTRILFKVTLDKWIDKK